MAQRIGELANRTERKEIRKIKNEWKKGWTEGKAS
jgi:hypothetical protein